MATRRTGIEYEREVVLWHRYNPNVLHVMRSAGSHGAADVVVFYPNGKVTLVQCKAGKVTEMDIQSVKIFSAHMGPKYVVELWRKEERFHRITTFIDGELRTRATSALIQREKYGD